MVAAIFALAVGSFTDLVKKPKLSLVIKQNGFYRDTILLSLDTNGEYIASFSFAIKNAGTKAIKPGEGFWNTYIENSTWPSNFKYFVAGEPNHQRDEIRYSVYPKSHTDIIDFSYNLRIKKDLIKDAAIPYMFQTDYGNFPKNLKWDSNTGAAPRKDFAFINLEQPL
jgi:hypothetical protein